jgi:hypothetical protein
MNTHITILEAILVSVVSLFGLVVFVAIQTAVETITQNFKKK